MKRTISIILGLSFISFSPLFSQEAKAEASEQAVSTDEAGSQSAEAFAIIPELKSEEETSIERNRTKATFKTNVKNCDIFLNGNNQGRSKLTLSNLIEGYYLLRVEKEGYIPTENFVYIEGGKAKTFYVELEMTEETKKKTEARQAARERAAAEAKERAEAAKKTAESQPEEETQTSESRPEATETLGDAK